MDELLLLSGREMARRVRRREVSSRALVEAHIAAIESCNDRINAVVEERFEPARAEADACDRRLADEADTEALGPYFGVPCTIKECFALEGFRQTSGLAARRAIRADHDATAVARLRAAGAIPLGTTNLSELCMWMESHNACYGRTNNPYDDRNIVGGSSGGEGAIVGAGASPFGLGSDIGGSIRLPAFFCGVFGHKPSGGLVPGTGQYPMAENDARSMLTTGPLCRRAEDLFPLLQIFAGPDGLDDRCRPMTLRDPADVRVADLRVLQVASDGLHRVHPALQRAQADAAGHLARIGSRVQPTMIDGFRYAFDYWSARMSAAADTPFADLMRAGSRTHFAAELVRFWLGRSDHTFPAIALALIEPWAAGTAAQTARAVADCRRLADDLSARLGDDGVLLYPTYPVPAPRHRHPVLRPTSWVYTALFNALELPVTQVPLGLTADRRPLGVQVVGAHGRDHLTIAVAQELERAFGGWVPPWTTGPCSEDAS